MSENKLFGLIGEMTKLIFVRIVSTLISAAIIFYVTKYSYGEEIESFLENKLNPKIELRVEGVAYENDGEFPVDSVLISIVDIGDYDITDHDGSFLIRFLIREDQNSITIGSYHSDYQKAEKAIFINEEIRNSGLITTDLYLKELN